MNIATKINIIITITTIIKLKLFVVVSLTTAPKLINLFKFT